MKTFLCVLALISGTAVIQAAPVAKPVAVPVVAEPLAEKDGLRISIIPTFNTEDIKNCIELLPQEPHINIVLKNVSSHPINVWAEYTFKGFRNLTLEITRIDGEVLKQPLIISRSPLLGGSSTSIETLSPGEVLIREVRLRVPHPLPAKHPLDIKSRELWYSNFPEPVTVNTYQMITMRAVFSNESADEGKTSNVWSGRIASDLKTYYVQRVDVLAAYGLAVF